MPPLIGPVVPCIHRVALAEVQSPLLAWQVFLNHRASHPAPQPSHTHSKQALSVLAWKLLNSDSAGKHSKMGRTVLKKVKNNQILLGMTWKKN